jgi:hypothetical protein
MMPTAYSQMPEFSTLVTAHGGTPIEDVLVFLGRSGPVMELPVVFVIMTSLSWLGSID